DGGKRILIYTQIWSKWTLQKSPTGQHHNSTREKPRLEKKKNTHHIGPPKPQRPSSTINIQRSYTISPPLSYTIISKAIPLYLFCKNNARKHFYSSSSPNS